VALAGVGAERFERARADAAARGGDGADEGEVVVLVRQQAQIGDEVANLGLVEEALPARHDIGDAVVAQLLLDDARLVVAAVQDA
jgi:hypothetical protein